MIDLIIDLLLYLYMQQIGVLQGGPQVSYFWIIIESYWKLDNKARF